MMEDKLNKIIELLEMLIAVQSEPVNIPSVWEDHLECPTTTTVTSSDKPMVWCSVTKTLIPIITDATLDGSG